MESVNILINYHGTKPIESLEIGDWIDLRAAETVELKAGDDAIISLGVSMRLPEGYEAHIAPRSSTYKKWGIIQVNSVGVIDNSYCGNNDIWKVPVHAILDTIIYEGDRICQFRIMKKQPPINFIETNDLGGEDRGGFGTTGHK